MSEGGPVAGGGTASGAAPAHGPTPEDGGTPTGRERLRGLWNLVNLATPLGLAGAVVAGCELRPGPHGLVQAAGWRHSFPGGAAFTVGDVVFTRPGLEMTPRLWRHEGAHAWQYAACLGLPFLPLYGAAATWSSWRTGDPASRNPFERGAGLRRGGYAQRAVLRGPGQGRRRPTRADLTDRLRERRSDGTGA